MTRMDASVDQKVFHGGVSVLRGLEGKRERKIQREGENMIEGEREWEREYER